MNATRRRYRAVLFDLPGTIISTDDNDQAHLHLMKSFIDRYGLRDEPAFLLEKFNARLGEPHEDPGKGWVSHRETVRRALAGMLSERGRLPAPGDEDWFYDEYLRKHQTFVRILPGADELLRKCDELGLHIGGLGNMDPDYMRQQLKWLALLDRLDSLTTPEEAGAPLPDSRMLKAALGKTGFAPENAIFVGSSAKAGVDAAKKLGMATVLVDTRMTQTELGPADFVASHPRRVTNILTELVYQP